MKRSTAVRRGLGLLVVGLALACTDRPTEDDPSGPASTTASASSDDTGATGLVPDGTSAGGQDSSTGGPPPACLRVIDDFEDGDVVPYDERGAPQGRWYLWSPGGVDPQPMVESPGVDGSQWAIGSELGYLMVDLADATCDAPPCPEQDRGSIDASAYAGLSFWTRVDDPVMFADVNFCATCTAERDVCLSMGTLFVPVDEWQQVFIDFDDIPDQGCAFDPGQLTAIAWSEHPDSGARMYIDDVCFY